MVTHLLMLLPSTYKRQDLFDLAASDGFFNYNKGKYIYIYINLVCLGILGYVTQSTKLHILLALWGHFVWSSQFEAFCLRVNTLWSRLEQGSSEDQGLVQVRVTTLNCPKVNIYKWFLTFFGIFTSPLWRCHLSLFLRFRVMLWRIIFFPLKVKKFKKNVYDMNQVYPVCKNYIRSDWCFVESYPVI